MGSTVGGTAGAVVDNAAAVVAHGVVVVAVDFVGDRAPCCPSYFLHGEHPRVPHSFRLLHAGHGLRHLLHCAFYLNMTRWLQDSVIW